MRLTFHYRPEGVDPREWDFTPLKMTNGEAEQIESLTDLTFVEWQNKLLRGSAACTRAYLFVLLKREKPKLTIDQVAFTMGEVEFEWVADEDDEDAEADDPKDDAETLDQSPSE